MSSENKEVENGFSDVVEIDLRIEEIEGCIQNLYTKLGEKCYEIYKEKPEESLKELMATITENMSEMKELQFKSNALKGIVQCAQCGTILTDTALFCVECGERVVKEKKDVPEGFVECGNCGVIIESNSKFCSNCGQRVEEKLLKESGIDKEEVSEDEGDVLENLATECTFCGFKLEPESVFCINCGKKISEGVQKKVVSNKNKYCNKCGQIVEKDAQFCYHCGKRVE